MQPKHPPNIGEVGIVSHQEREHGTLRFACIHGVLQR